MSTSYAIGANLCTAYNIGLVEYDTALKLQGQLVKARLNGEIADTILFLQHPPVLTIGAGGGDDNIISSRHALAEKGVAVVPTDRGGNISCHEPGQLVGYPIFDLTARGKDLHRYIHDLEEVIIRALRDYGIEAQRDSRYPGVWVGDDKVCALGIRVTRWVTKHGFALNVNNDLKCFSYVHPCGINNCGITSLSRLLNREVAIEDLTTRIIGHWMQVFNMTIELESPERLSNYYVE